MSVGELRELLSQPAIAEALRAVFGTRAPEALEPLYGGLSAASVCLLTIGGRRDVLRHELGKAPADAERELACRAIAADRGLAPRVYYASAESGVSISDFIDGPTLGEWVRAGNDPLPRLGALLRALHTGPAFPAFISVRTGCEGFAAALVRRGGQLAGLDEHLARLRELAAALAPHVVELPCHNDLNPGNLLVHGERLWAIDWGAAGAGDPFHDLATQGVFLLRSPEQRARLLRAYLGRAASEIEQARSVCSRALALIANALILANIAHGRPAPPEPQASPVTDPGRFATGLARTALELYASPEYAAALAALGGARG